MMTVDEMNSIRQELDLTYQKICFASGVPISTVQKILGGTTTNPRISTMEQLDEAFRRLKDHADRRTMREDKGETRSLQQSSQKRRDGRYISGQQSFSGDVLRESAASYGASALRTGSSTTEKQSEIYTAADRDALPPERRTELIDGVLYDMASPRVIHQKVSLGVYNQILDCIRAQQSDCELFAAPTDVCIDRDPYTIVVPDVFIVCDHSKVTSDNIQGAPDFILEVISPSTANIDKFIKLEKYRNAGVREYWIIDIKRQKVIVYSETEEKEQQAARPKSDAGRYRVADSPEYDVTTYTFSDEIPLHISGGKCSIDMKPIRQELERFKD